MLLNVAFSELKMKKGKVVLTNGGSIVPKASASTDKPEEKEIGTVFITKDGKTYIQDKEVSAEQIESEIRAGEYKAVIIKSDGAAQFQSVVAALDGCKKAGIVKYSIDTAQAQ